MRDQVQKLEGVLNVCVLQSVGEEEGEGKVHHPGRYQEMFDVCRCLGTLKYSIRGQQECCQNAYR